MLNPYESHEVYYKMSFELMQHRTTISMTKSLRRLIEQTLCPFDAEQAIIFFKIPLPTNANDAIDPVDQITFEFILNFILFNGKHYTFNDPSNFRHFFLILDWTDVTNPIMILSMTDLFWNIIMPWNYVKQLIPSVVVNYFSDSTRIPVMSMSLCVFNFFMNLPFVILNFDTVKNTNPMPIGSQTRSISPLGQHFVPVFTGSFTSSEIIQLMNKYYTNNPIIFEDGMRDMLRFLYSIEYNTIDVDREFDAEAYFKHVLRPICEFINSTSDRKFTIEQKYPRSVKVSDFIDTTDKEETRHIIPDLVISEETQPKIVIEMKAPPLFKRFKVPRFNKMISTLSEFMEEEDDSEERERFQVILKQLLIYMIGLKCSRGMVSDGYSVILVEIDNLKLEKQYKESRVNELPIKLTTFDCKSSNPSYLQGILYFLMREVLEPIILNDKLLHFKVALHTREEIIKGNIGGKTPSVESEDQSINTSISPLFISWEDKPKVLQNVFDHLSHVVKIKAKFVKNYILDDIDDDDDVVVKIFDPKLTRIEKLDRIDIMYNVNTFYRREKSSAEIHTSMNVDTLYLKQVYGNAIYNYGYGPLVKGKFIVSRYFKADELPITNEVFKMAEEQLSKIHDVGIAHGDIRESNILFNKEYNKVYLIDFGHAIIKGSIDDRSDIQYYSYGFKKAVDRDCLAGIFSDVI